MNRKLRLAPLASLVVAAILVVSTLAACGTSTPAPSPSKPPSSPAASTSSPSAASPSASASAKPASPEQQAYQKALDNFNQVVEAARKEPKPVALFSVWEPDFLTALEQGFNKVDPNIQVKFTRMTGAVASERIKGEQATKQYVSNVYFGGSPANRPMAEAGLGQLFEDLPVLLEPGVKWVKPVLMDKPHETFTVAFTNYHIIYNTNLVPAGQEPKTWKDLANPIFKDKLVLWEPRIPSIGQAVLGTLYLNPEYGPDLVRKIVENTRVVNDSTAVPRMVATGEMAVGVTTWGGYLPVKDAPVKVVGPADGAISSPLQGTVIKNAPALNTTKVFLNWILGKEAQTILSAGYAAIRPDITARAKETQIFDAKLMPNVPYTWDFEMTKMKDAAKVFGKWLDDMGK